MTHSTRIRYARVLQHCDSRFWKLTAGYALWLNLMQQTLPLTILRGASQFEGAY